MTQTSFLVGGLANFVAGLRFDNLSERAVDVAKQCVLDCYGSMVYGRYCETAAAIMAYLDASETVPVSEPRVSVLDVKGRKADKEASVFVHTMMARSSDLDDGYSHAMGHPGSVLVPLALSLAQLYGRKGEDVLTALVAAYDIYARLGETFNPFMYRERGFDATGVCGAVASAALAGKMAGSSPEVIKNAMGLASLVAGGLTEYQNDGSSGKIFCGGWGALSGMRALALADCGFSGPDAALEGKKGFFQGFVGTSGCLDTHGVLENLGSVFKITDIYFKRHACMRGVHAVLDAVLDIRAEGELSSSDVKKVDVFTSTFLLRLSNPAPATVVGAQASVQCSSAVALKYGRIDSEEILSKGMSDKEVMDLAARIFVLEDDSVQQYLAENPTHFCAARVVLETFDNRRYERWAPVARGGVEMPFGWDVLGAKFENLMRDTPFLETAKERYTFISDLENAQDIDMLFVAS